MQRIQIDRLLRCGVSVTLISSMAIPSLAMAAPAPTADELVAAIEQVQPVQTGDQSAVVSTDDTDGVTNQAAGAIASENETADQAADSADGQAPDDVAPLLRYAGDDENAATDTSGDGLLADQSEQQATDADGNVTIIVELERGGNQGVSPLSLFGIGNASEQRHNYFKNKVRELAGQAEDNGMTTYSLAADPVQDLHDYYNVIDGFAMKAPAATLDDIKALDGVANAFIENSYEIPEDQADTTPANQDSLSMTGAGEVDYTGKGQLIAVIDSGLDTDHEVFSGDSDDASVAMTEPSLDGMRGSLGAGSNAAYVSEKIPFAYDYVDGDNDVNPSAAAGEHGTHVTGIAAANGGKIRGTAPDAQIAFMKVASDYNGSLPDSAILAALDDVAVIGATSVNMSFGIDAGFAAGESYPTYERAFDTLEQKGVTLNVAAGNAYSSALGNQSGSNLPYATDPDSSMIATPGALSDAFAVASADTSGEVSAFTAAGKSVPYYNVAAQDGSGATTVDFSTVPNGTYDVIDAGYGSDDDFENFAYKLGYDYDWSNTIVMIKRGSADGSQLTFAKKVANVEDYCPDAKAVVIYNNESGALTNAATDKSLKVPAVTISKEDGEAILAQGSPTITVAQGTSVRAATTVSSYSSWGVTPDLKLKPEILAPGGSVYSSVLDGKYATMSGTSMATPQMTGIAAQLAQYMDADGKFAGLTDEQKGDLTTLILMSTATPAADGSSYVSPRHQGAGMTNVPAAVATNVYATVDGADNDSRAKANLGESSEGSWTFTVTLHNLGNSAQNFTFDGAALSEKVADGLFQQSSENWTGKGISVACNGAADGSVTVPANGTAKATITVTCDDTFTSWASANTPNGTFVDGFAMFKAADGSNNGADLSVPFMGFYGDWGKASAFDGNLLNDTYHMYGSALVDGNNGLPLGLNLLDQDAVTMAQIGDYSKVDQRKATVSNMSYSTAPGSARPVTGLLRNVDTLSYSYTNAEDEEVLSYDYDYVRKSYYHQSNGEINYVEACAGSAAFAGKDNDGQALPDGQYTLTETANISGDDTVQTGPTYSFYYDTTAPQISNVKLNGQGDGATVSFDVTDAGWLAAFDFHDPSTGAYFYRVITGDPAETTEDGLHVWHCEAAVSAIKAAWSAAGLGEMPNTVPLYAWDYGQNPSARATAVITAVPATSITLDQTELSLAPGQTTQLSATISPDDSTESSLVWSSSNEAVATVDDTGRVSALANGTATITVASAYNPEVKAEATLTVADLSEDVGIAMAQDELQVKPGAKKEISAVLAASLAGSQVTWESSDESVAKVAANADDSTRATLTAGTSIGDATITASATTASGETVSAQMTIKVRPANYNEFLIDESTGTLIAYGGNAAYVEIPSNVKHIGKQAFMSTPVQSVFISASVEDIGDQAFMNANKMTNVWVEDTPSNPSHLKSIGSEAFYYTISLATAKFPQSLETIGERAFYESTVGTLDLGGVTELPNDVCNQAVRLYDLTISDKMTSIGASAFQSCQALTEIKLSNTEEGAATTGLPSHLETIGKLAFSGMGRLSNSSIGTLTCPDTLRSIGDSAWANASSLSGIVLNDKLETIGGAAFAGTAISELTVPDSVTNVCYGAFQSMGSLQKITLGNGVADDALISAFVGDTALQQIIVADDNPNYTVTDNVLFNKSKTKLVTYPLGVAGDYAIPEGVTEVCDSAFAKSQVANVTFPSTLTKLGGSAFSESAIVGDVVLPAGMETISGYAFINTHISSANIGGTKTIGGSAFYSCVNLASIDFGTRLETVGSLAFGNGTPLTEVVLPDTVTSVGKGSFANNSALTKVHIGAGLTMSFSILFTGCNNVSELTVSPDNPVYYTSNGEGYSVLFSKMEDGLHAVLALPTNTYTEYTMPEGTVAVDKQAFRNNKTLKKLVLNEGLKKLDTGAFNNCSALTDVTFPDSLEYVDGFYSVPDIDPVELGTKVKEVKGNAFMGADPQHLIIHGGQDGAYTSSMDFGGKGMKTAYFGTGMTSINYTWGKCPTTIVASEDMTSLTLRLYSMGNTGDIMVYAPAKSAGYNNARSGLVAAGLDPSSHLKEYTELGVEATASAEPVGGQTVSVKASTTGGVDGAKEYQFYQVAADGTKTVLRDWSEDASFDWKVPADGSSLYVDARDATLVRATAEVTATEQPGAKAEVPTISTQPQSVSVCKDAVAKLTVEAASPDGGELSYQWYCDGEAIQGATEASYEAPTAEAGEHSYYVVVTNTKDGMTATAQSDAATVSVCDLVAGVYSMNVDVVKASNVTDTSSMMGDFVSDHGTIQIKDGKYYLVLDLLCPTTGSLAGYYLTSLQTFEAHTLNGTQISTQGTPVDVDVLAQSGDQLQQVRIPLSFAAKNTGYVPLQVMATGMPMTQKVAIKLDWASVAKATVDKDALDALVAKAQVTDQGSKTDEAFATLQDAIAAAQAVAADETALPVDVAAARDALQKALDAFAASPDVVVIDRSALTKAIADAQAIEQGNKTNEAYAALKDAIAAAQAVADDENATQEQVNASVDALAKAVEAFENSADEQTGLIEGVEYKIPVTATDEAGAAVQLSGLVDRATVTKTADGYQVCVVLKDADGLYVENATIGGVAADSFYDAQGERVLRATIPAIDGTVAFNATVFNVTQGKTVQASCDLAFSEDGAVKAEPDEQVKPGATVAKADLVRAIAAAQGVQFDGERVNAYKALQDAIAAAAAVNGAADATQAQVDRAACDVLAAIERYNQVVPMSTCGIEAIGEQPYTGSAIEPAVVVKAADGTVLTAGMDYTVAFSENVEPGQATVMVTGTGAYEGTLTITFAIAKADTSELAAAIEQARAIEQGKKSDEAFAELTNAIAVAQALVDKPAATQTEVAGALEALGKAVEAFEASPDVAVVDRGALTKAIADAQAVEQGKKTDEAFKTLQDAIKAAQKIANDESATQEQVNEAAAALSKAVETFKASPDGSDKPDTPGTDDPSKPGTDEPGTDDPSKPGDNAGTNGSDQSNNSSTVTPGGTTGSTGGQGSTAAGASQNGGKSSGSLATTGDTAPVAAAGAAGIFAALVAAVSQVLRRRKSED